MIKNQIKGSASQMVVCQLDQGQTIFCEAGKFLWKTTNVSMETRLGKGTPQGQDAGGGGAGGHRDRTAHGAGELPRAVRAAGLGPVLPLPGQAA